MFLYLIKHYLNKKPVNNLFTGFLWRRGRDSNPRALARKLISSQPRYDHFDTSPYHAFTKKYTCAKYNCIRAMQAQSN